MLSTGTNTCPQPWAPLINGLVDDALLELSPDRNWPLLFLHGSVVTLFRWSWKILSYFVANLSKTLRINFYQNRSSIVDFMIKKFWCVFYASQCSCCRSIKLLTYLITVKLCEQDFLRAKCYWFVLCCQWCQCTEVLFYWCDLHVQRSNSVVNALELLMLPLC